MTSNYHSCHFPGCARKVPPEKLACVGHWFALPDKLREAIWRYYRRGQETDKKPSYSYLAVQRLCCCYWVFKPHDEEAARESARYLAEAVHYAERAKQQGRPDPLEGLVPMEKTG
jgi:hypothetical protein